MKLDLLDANNAQNSFRAVSPAGAGTQLSQIPSGDQLWFC
jgi:hypothetical protein